MALGRYSLQSLGEPLRWRSARNACPARTLRSTASLARTDEFHSTVPSLRHCAPSGDFSHDCLTLRLRSARPVDEILLDRADHRRRTLSCAGAELLSLPQFGAAIRRRQLGATATTSTLRLGDGRNHCRHVDMPAGLLRGRLFLGNRRDGAGSPDPESALRLSRFPILQLFRFPLRNHHRHHFLNVGASSTATPLLHHPRLCLDGALFHYHPGGGQVHRVQLRLSASQTGGENVAQHSLGQPPPLSFRNATPRTRVFCRALFAIRHLRFHAKKD